MQRVLGFFIASLIGALAVIGLNAKGIVSLPVLEQATHPPPSDKPQPKSAKTRPATMSADAKARAILNKMSTEQKVGQLFMINKNSYTSSSRFQPGGIIYFGDSLSKRTPSQVADLSKMMQARAAKSGSPLPLFVATDQEYGNVSRLKDGITRFPGNMALGATDNPDLARQAAKIGGSELNQMGINFNMAPVSDVNYNPQNPVIGERSFGDNPQVVAKFTTAAVHGYQSAGIAATVKHFPGHGNAATDSHLGLPVIADSRSQFFRMNLPPFRAITSTAEAIMTAHISVPALDNSKLPATLSPKILEFLRKDLGYKGLIITDSLSMEGVRHQGLSDAQVAVKAFKAGADILLMPPNFPAAYQAILTAAKKGYIGQKRLNQSVLRIIRLKLKLSKAASAFNSSRVGSRSSLQVADQVASRSVTVINPNVGLQTIRPKQKVLVTGWGDSTPIAMASFIPRSVSKPLGDQISTTAAQAVATEAAAYPVVVVITYGTNGVGLAQLLIRQGHKGVYIVPTGTPYYVAPIKGAKAIVTAYGYQTVNLKAVANVLTGKAKATGKLPVKLP